VYLPAQGRDGLVIFDHAHIAETGATSGLGPQQPA
jgi:hypothetical protein